MALAFSTAARISSRVISRARWPRLMPPTLFTPRTCEPPTPTMARSMGAEMPSSASSTAFCTEATARSRSMITPLREPSESAIPWLR